MEDNIQPAVMAIQNYYSELHVAATATMMMDEDMRSLYSDFDLYYNNSDEDAEMKSFYFFHEILAPLQRTFILLQKNAGIYLSAANLPKEYRLSSSEAAALLKTKFIRCRGLILDSIHCPSSDFDNVKKGIMEANGEALQKVSQDLTKDFMGLEFAHRVSQRLSNYSDDVIAAVYRPGCEIPMPVCYGNELPFEEARETAKRGIVDFWKNADIYSTSEIEIVEEIIKSDIFKPFREDCAVLFQRETGQRPMRPYRKQVSPATITNSTQHKDVLSGVREFADYLPAGLTKAQEILNSGILQEAGISYRVGNKHIINREKLDEFRKNNPNAFANLPKKKG